MCNFSFNLPLMPRHRTLSTLVIALASLVILPLGAGAAHAVDGDWTLNTEYQSTLGTAPGGEDKYVTAAAAQSDGKVIVGGGFVSWDGTEVGRLVRLNADGSRDSEFTAANGSGANNFIRAITVQADGKILVGGQFSSWNGSTNRGLVRLNQDGSLDTSFSTLGNTTVSAIAVDSEGRILVGGNFTEWNEQSVGRLVRLNSDGSTDAGFREKVGAAADNYVRAIALTPAGKIIIGGQFSEWEGTYSVGRVVRLDADGTYDSAFTVALGSGANSDVWTLATSSDGSLLVGGKFTSWNSTTVGGLVRVNSAGALDSDFTANVGSGAADIWKVLILTTGNIAVVGTFTTWNGDSAGNVMVLNPDGAVNSGFASVMGTGANRNILALSELSDGNIVMGGDSSLTSWNSSSIPGFFSLTGGPGVPGGGSDNSGSVVRPSVPDVIQQYPISAEIALSSEPCAATAPDYTVDGKTNKAQQFDGWSVSYAQWRNAGAGGYVCTRTLVYDTRSQTWLTSPSLFTGSGQLQQYPIVSTDIATLRDTVFSNESQARAAYCRVNAPDNEELGKDWGQRNQGWSPTFAMWMNNGSGGWVCSRTL